MVYCRSFNKPPATLHVNKNNTMSKYLCSLLDVSLIKQRFNEIGSSTCL